MMHTPIRPPLTGELLDKVDGLTWTVNQITTLLELAASQLKILEDAAIQTDSPIANLAEWNAVRTLLNVSDQSLDQIRAVSEAVAATSRPGDLA